MSKFIILSVLLLSTSAFAGSNEGAVSCRRGNELIAVYSWFHSVADTWAQAFVYTRGGDGTYTRFDGATDEALKPVVVEVNGRRLTITPDLEHDGCLID